MRTLGILLLGLLAAFTGVCSVTFLTMSGTEIFTIPGLAIAAGAIWWIVYLVRNRPKPPGSDL
jgi:hypothetical protein